jgi:hypothetical protein
MSGPASSNSHEAGYGFCYEMDLKDRFWLGDPFLYHVGFEAKFVGFKDYGARYEIEGSLQTDFDFDTYMFMSRKALFKKLFGISADHFAAKITAFPWHAKLSSKVIGKEDVELISESVKKSFIQEVRKDGSFLDNVVKAIRARYDEITTFMETHKDADKIKEFIPRVTGAFEKEQTTNIFDYLFGERWRSCQDWEVRVDDQTGTICIPNFWVQTSNDPMATKNFVGFGARPNVVNFHNEPFPWAFLSIRRIDNPRDRVLQMKKRANRKAWEWDVYIVGCVDGRMKFKNLSEKYMDVAEDQLELVSSIAVGVLQGKESEAKTP